jgi:phage FluMu protein Com
MESKIIVIRRFDSPIEANIVKGKLLDEHIQCFLKDEHIVGIIPYYSTAVGGVKLMIFENDKERANELLNQLRSNYKEEVKCPSCGSLNVHYITEKHNTWNWFSLLVSFLLCIYPFYLKKKYECGDCKSVYDI